MSKDQTALIPRRLKEVKPETHNATSFIFDKPDGFTYTAGQYARWRLGHPDSDERGITRPFTISSSPTEEFLMLTTKFAQDRGSTFKRALAGLEVGSEILFEGPKGEFILPDDENQEVVFLGGGVGITPFRSMIKFSTDTHSPRIIRLIYANKAPGDIIYHREFDAWAEANPSLKLTYTVDDPDDGWTGETGYLTPELLRQHIPDLDKPIFFICGPEGMIAAYTEVLTSLAVTPDRIRTENFSGY
jgi:ferredoxin-NADP reductase